MPVAPRVTTFADDVEFLQRHADAVVLRGQGCGPVVVSGSLNGRAMTSAFADDEPGFGLVNRANIERPPPRAPTRAFDNFGGEDRLWITPEGGPWALFFAPGAEQTGAHWSVPDGIDARTPGRVPAIVPAGAQMRWDTSVTNIAGTTFGLRVARTIAALSRGDVGALLGADPWPDGLRVVAFRSTNVLSWSGLRPSGAGEVGLWVLGQFAPGDGTRVLVPFRGPLACRDADPLAAIKRDHFGVVPEDRLALLPAAGAAAAPSATLMARTASAVSHASGGVTGVARFAADGRLRGKIGLSRAGATGWLGAWDSERGVLTLVHHTLPAPDALVPDCDWKPDNPHPGKGDVATSYNDGGDPRFFELESLSSALPRETGAAVKHEHTTIHLGGAPEALARIVRAILHAEL